MWRLGDVFSYPCLCVHRREKADSALISYNRQEAFQMTLQWIVAIAPSVILELQ